MRFNPVDHTSSRWRVRMDYSVPLSRVISSARASCAFTVERLGHISSPDTPGCSLTRARARTRTPLPRPEQGRRADRTRCACLIPSHGLRAAHAGRRS